MSPRPAPEVLDPSFYDHLGEVPEALLAGDLYWSVELIERYAREWAIELAHALGVPQALAGAPPGSGRSTAGSLAHHLGLAPGSEVPLAWLLAELTEAGELQEAACGISGATVRLAGELRPAHREAFREAALEHDPANAPFLDLLDLAGRVWPRVVTGQVRGEAVLLGPDQLGLWLRFFSNDNPVYAVNNRLAAVAAANRLAERTRALEVGAGAGSGSAALFEELERTGRLGRLATLRLTEPAAMLRRRAVRELERRWPGAPVEAAELDIDRPWAEQGVEPGSLDLVFGVNVLHVARDLAWTLAEARRALRPGGWLVAGECLRPRPGRPVAAEMIFLLLEGFREVRLDPELRPGPGFLTPELWVAQLENAGFERVELVPDVRLLREIHPRFATGAVCGWVGEPR
ncbi:MAG TPA: class I SAM-dependent methyltransferase [Thermoanaerobaculia bacterium]|nr:class I SAM-dependent methyltransferase [Thermoanaerobaculia bacterium]